MPFDTRESYLTEAAALILDDQIMPAVERSRFDFPRPTYRVSVGFPKHARSGRVIAQCFSTDASSDGVNEIFVNPEIDEPLRVLDALTHELIHAVDNCESGHRNFFATLARSVGLEGKLTATVAGPALRNALEDYCGLLGGYPHKRMNASTGHKKSSTRMLKLSCSECGFVCRTSAKWLGLLDPDARCPVCQHETLNP